MTTAAAVAFQGSDVTVEGCSFVDNWAQVFVETIVVSNATISHCRFFGGYLSSDQDAGVSVAGGTFEGCVIANYTSGGHGEAVVLHLDSGTILNTTFVNNRVSSTLISGNTITIANGLVAFTTCEDPESTVVIANAAVSISCSNIFGTQGGNWTGALAADSRPQRQYFR